MSTPTIPEQLLETRLLVSFREFGAMLGISSSGVRQQADRGAIPTVPVGGRRMVPISEVRRIKRASDQAAANRAAAEAPTA